jgi:hypothetical protein
MSTFKKFDIYSKTVDGVNKQTRIGGFVTVVSCLLLSALFLSELRDYLKLDVVSRMIVDSSVSKNTVALRFDIEFPSVSCKCRL